jgi:hypothetical protein
MCEIGRIHKLVKNSDGRLRLCFKIKQWLDQMDSGEEGGRAQRFEQYLCLKFE